METEESVYTHRHNEYIPSSLLPISARIFERKQWSKSLENLHKRKWQNLLPRATRQSLDKSRQQTVRLRRLLIVQMIRRRTKLAARSLRVECKESKNC